MAVKVSELKAGQVYDLKSCGGGRVTIVGFDPNEKKWVGSCPDWCMVISHIDWKDCRKMVRVQ